MQTRRQQRFLHAQAVWMCAVLLLLAALGSLTLELFFVLSFIGFLIVVELTASFNVAPRWRARLKWLIALGLLGFVSIIVRRLLEVLPPGLV
jgi:hypothetical protein